MSKEKCSNLLWVTSNSEIRASTSWICHAMPSQSSTIRYGRQQGDKHWDTTLNPKKAFQLSKASSVKYLGFQLWANDHHILRFHCIRRHCNIYRCIGWHYWIYQFTFRLSEVQWPAAKPNKIIFRLWTNNWRSYKAFWLEMWIHKLRNPCNRIIVIPYKKSTTYFHEVYPFWLGV